MSTTVTYDGSGLPTTTLTDDGTAFEAVLELDGLDPQRGTTAEERARGISSLNPPTVRVRKRVVAADAHRALIDAAKLAVEAAVVSTNGDTGGPADLLMCRFKVAVAVRGALRLLGEEI
jgi:hypothetical protein